MKKVLGWLVIVVIVLIGLSKLGVYKPSELTLSLANSAKFGDITIADKYVISQMEVDRKSSKPTVTADFKTQIDTVAPLEVSTVFYDSSQNRLGKATSLIGTGMSKGHITTLSFNFEGAVGDLSKIANVRVEVQELSPLMLLERTTNKLKP